MSQFCRASRIASEAGLPGGGADCVYHEQPIIEQKRRMPRLDSSVRAGLFSGVRQLPIGVNLR
jgi:hypothetical protein